MRIVDALQAFPGLILALAITAALGPGIGNAMIAIGIVAAPAIARLTRGPDAGDPRARVRGGGPGDRRLAVQRS